MSLMHNTLKTIELEFMHIKRTTQFELLMRISNDYEIDLKELIKKYVNSDQNVFNNDSLFVQNSHFDSQIDSQNDITSEENNEFKFEIDKIIDPTILNSNCDEKTCENADNESVQSETISFLQRPNAKQPTTKTKQKKNQPKPEVLINAAPNIQNVFRPIKIDNNYYLLNLNTEEVHDFDDNIVGYRANQRYYLRQNNS